ncbi:TonB-dependent receptor domain-containing protein [Novosphingobium sp. RL4]|uniref:TonB-dependent receptor domain-containing protein n=1 Tax=Novosphingobium sp. RL4 TaxID=3109595 RepID=UPI002D76CA61|nr:TonB-dependent receptor [Novosphingobium sp. RL4]WRT92152.1 TonB-dependent receptor [Novosphingobium sp. RL4]
MTSEMKRLLLASTLLMGLPAMAHAQDSTPANASANAADAEPEGGAIVVTGSRLSNPNLEQAAPIMAVSAKEIALTGQVNVENILKDLPQILPGSTAASNNPGGGVATADLRGLGAARTLVLVNGHRYVSYDTNQIVDLNTIPTALIERVDVVTGGKSAVYGSDAVTGVVNFVTKQDFDGVQANANYRLTGEGDGAQYNGGLLVGKNFADGRGNITIYGDYMRRKSILQSGRSYTSVAQTDGTSGLVAGGSGTTPDGKVTLDGTGYKFAQDGSYSLYESPADAYNYASENYLQVPQKRELLSAQWHFDVSDHLTLYGEGQYIHNRVKNQLAPTPLTGTFSIDTDSSFLSSSSQALLASYDTDGDGYTSTAINRRLTEVGDRISNMDSKAYRGLIGARGQISGNWNYDAYFSYSRTRQVERQSGNVSASRVQQALQTTYDSSGNLVCSDTSNGCVPLNIFGAGNISQEAADFISIDTVNRSTITEKVASGAITNSNLFDLGAGPAGLAFGAEYRSEHGSFEPDEALASGDVIGFNSSEPIAGGYNVKELFAEIDVPLIADKPFIHRLDFNGAYRFSDYSNAVSQVSTFSAGLVWSPVKDISFRGQFSRAVRAPTVNDLFSGNAQNYESATDPCAKDSATGTSEAITNANLNASCLASGIPASKIGNYTADSQIESYNGGNTALREETANTWTVGTMIQPRFAPGLSFTVDYYHIKIDNFITAVGTSNIIKSCYGTKENGWTPIDTSACALLPRDSNTYMITGAIDNLTNSGGVKTDGIDFDAQYAIPLAFGAQDSSKLTLRVSGTRLLHWTFNPTANLSSASVECAGKFGLLCNNVYAKWRLNSRATWSTDGATVSLAWRHLSPVKDDDNSTKYTVEKIKAYDYFDLTAQIDVADRFTWNIGMNNMFNKKPPILGDNQEQSNTYPTTYDVYGRTFFTGVTVNF